MFPLIYSLICSLLSDEGHLTIFWGSFPKCRPTFQCVCLGTTGTWGSTGWSCPATCGTSSTTWTGERAGSRAQLLLPSPSVPAELHIHLTCALCPASGSQSSLCLTSSSCWHHGPFHLEQIVCHAPGNSTRQHWDMCLAACAFQKCCSQQVIFSLGSPPVRESSAHSTAALWSKWLSCTRASQYSCVLVLPLSIPHAALAGHSQVWCPSPARQTFPLSRDLRCSATWYKIVFAGQDSVDGTFVCNFMFSRYFLIFLISCLFMHVSGTKKWCQF